jgi:hypothetical protein
MRANKRPGAGGTARGAEADTTAASPTANKATKQAKRAEYSFDLVGRRFEITGPYCHRASAEHDWSGVVKAIVGDDKALVQFNRRYEDETGRVHVSDWLEIVWLDAMANSGPGEWVHWRWEFFEKVENSGDAS